jgi:hypothetical protein
MWKSGKGRWRRRGRRKVVMDGVGIWSEMEIFDQQRETRAAGDSPSCRMCKNNRI